MTPKSANCIFGLRCCDTVWGRGGFTDSEVWLGRMQAHDLGFRPALDEHVQHSKQMMHASTCGLTVVKVHV